MLAYFRLLQYLIVQQSPSLSPFPPQATLLIRPDCVLNCPPPTPPSSPLYRAIFTLQKGLPYKRETNAFHFISLKVKIYAFNNFMVKAGPMIMLGQCMHFLVLHFLSQNGFHSIFVQSPLIVQQFLQYSMMKN